MHIFYLLVTQYTICGISNRVLFQKVVVSFTKIQITSNDFYIIFIYTGYHYYILYITRQCFYNKKESEGKNNHHKVRYRSDKNK